MITVIQGVWQQLIQRVKVNHLSFGGTTPNLGHCSLISVKNILSTNQLSFRCQNVYNSFKYWHYLLKLLRTQVFKGFYNFIQIFIILNFQVCLSQDQYKWILSKNLKRKAQNLRKSKTRKHAQLCIWECTVVPELKKITIQRFIDAQLYLIP